MTLKPLGVGIVGLNPGTSWASRSHLPALRALSGQFSIIGVANRSAASSQAAAAEAGITRGFDSVEALINSADVDIVTVTVRVPEHRKVVEAALRAGKHVYCEWPLGIDLKESEALASLARETGLCAVIGTQAAVAPEIEHARTLIAQGQIGEVLSVSALGSGMSWGQEIDKRNAYLLDRKNGATMLSIPVGHLLAGIQRILGPVASVAGAERNGYDLVRIAESRDTAVKTAPDQISFIGHLQSGAQLSVHYRAGTPPGLGLYWEILGTEGTIMIEAVNGHPQMMPLTLRMARQGEQVLTPILPPPGELEELGRDAMARNVGIIYARMAKAINGEKVFLPQFDDAQALHQVIDAIGESSSKRRWVDIEL